MNLDLLQKLVKLANNNPNDNEANLAARKVCRIIEEGKFNFNGNGNVNTNQHIPPKQPTTWNDVTRSTEPQWRSYSNPYSNAYADFFKQYYTQAREGSYNSYNKDSRKRAEAKENSERNRPPKRDIICTSCNKTFNSSYNKPEPFLCNDCQWKKYEGDKYKTNYDNRNKVYFISINCTKCSHGHMVGKYTDIEKHASNTSKLNIEFFCNCGHKEMRHIDVK